MIRRNHAGPSGQSHNSQPGLGLQGREQQQESVSTAPGYVKSAPETSMRSSTINALTFLLPTFITASTSPSALSGPTRRTAFLDGLRGVIAVMVSLLHQMGRTKYSYGRPYYLGPYREGENPQDFTSLAQLPIIRVFFAGGTGVSIFFIISGFALSLRPVQILRRIEAEASISKRYTLQGTLVEKLSSSMFRRGFRLFLPCVAGIFLFECMDAIGMFHIPHTAPGLWGYVLHFHYFLDVMSRSVWNIDGQMVNVLRHLWTVPVEFSCSMALFLVIVGISSFSTKGRMRCLAGLMFLSFYYDHPGFFGFVGGMFLAESEERLADSIREKDTTTHHIQDDGNDRLSPNAGTAREPGGEHQRSLALGDSAVGQTAPTSVEAASWILYYGFWILVLLTSLYILGWPSINFEKEPILRRVNWALGRNRSLGLASFAFVACFFRLPWLQTVFRTPFALYLGNISYSVYCVHYTFIIALEQGISSHVSTIFGPERLGHLNRFVANIYEAALMQFVILWASDLFWRLVDVPVQRFTRRMEQKCKTVASG